MTLQSDVPQRDVAGKPLPVVVRLYQLSSKDRFEKTDFLSLAKNDQKLLEKDILWRKEVTLFPNTELVLKEERKKGAQYFAVMALFREKGLAWQQVVDLSKLWTLSVQADIAGRRSPGRLLQHPIGALQPLCGDPRENIQESLRGGCPGL